MKSHCNCIEQLTFRKQMVEPSPYVSLSLVGKGLLVSYHGVVKVILCKLSVFPFRSSNHRQTSRQSARKTLHLYLAQR